MRRARKRGALLILFLLAVGGAATAASDGGATRTASRLSDDSDFAPPPGRADAGVRRSAADQELIDNLELLQNLDSAKDMYLLIELSKGE